ncbi:MAG: RNase H-like domain-containing protein, partial [Sediminibacterium sp.]
MNQILNKSANKCDDKDFIFSVSSEDQVKYPEVKMLINDTPFEIKIDTMSSLNILDENSFNKMVAKPKLKPRNKPAYAYGVSEPIKFLGEFYATFKVGRKVIRDVVVVAKGGFGSLLGFPTAQKLGVDPVSQILFADTVSSISDVRVPNAKGLEYYKQMFPNVFSGKIGEFKDLEINLHIDESVKPVQAKPRNTPYHLRKAIEEDLKFKLENGIIEKVEDEPTGWLNESVCRPKPNGKVRTCVDMRVANTAISCEKHEMPNVENILQTVNGMKFFGKVDLNNAFEQMRLAKKSRDISTFRTHIGIFRYKRLFFGINSAPEIFNAKIRKLLEGINCQVNACDDILGMGETLEDYENVMLQILQRLSDNNLTVNVDKCVFGVTEIEFFGMKLSAKGVSLNEEKTKALLEASAPINKSELHSFLGLTSYASKWIDKLAITAVPLWGLLKQEVRWHWETKHQESFEKIKAMMVESIGYFSMDWDTQVHVDASPEGAAAVLAQIEPKTGEKKIIRHISRAFTDTEKRYSQIEKEALALVWACERLDLYLLGKEFTIYTDNKAVELIFKNPLSKPPARILRWALRMSQFKYKVVHKPGLGNIADFLSRHPLQNTDMNEDVEEFINMIVNNTITKTMTKEMILEETMKDVDLTKLKQMIKDGVYRPCTELKGFSNIFGELTVTDEGLILRDMRMVLPVSLHKKAIQIAHEGHQGIRKTKELLRSKIWFPNIDKFTETFYKNCSCQADIYDRNMAPLSMSEMPDGPWTNISIDYYGPFDGVYIIVIHCDYSRFVLVEIVSSTAAKIIIERLESMFSIFGIPVQIRTDNGSPFQSEEFAKFAEYMGFKHRKITPYWPRANGEAESFMKNLSKVLRTAQIDQVPWRQRLREFLRAYRSTPHSTTKVAPAALFLRNGDPSRLKSFKSYFVPGELDKIARENDSIRKGQMKEEGDKRLHAHTIHIQKGDYVIVRQPKHNKQTPKYDPVPYMVREVKGNMVTAIRDNHQICRNVSFFKLINKNSCLFKPAKKVRFDQSAEKPKENIITTDLIGNVVSRQMVDGILLSNSNSYVIEPNMENSSSTNSSSENSSSEFMSPNQSEANDYAFNFEEEGGIPVETDQEQENSMMDFEQAGPGEPTMNSTVRRSNRTKVVPTTYKEHIYKLKTSSSSKSKRAAKRSRKASRISYIDNSSSQMEVLNKEEGGCEGATP